MRYCDKNAYTVGHHNSIKHQTARDTYGQMYLSILSPNRIIGSQNGTPVFIPIRKENSILVCNIRN